MWSVPGFAHRRLSILLSSSQDKRGTVCLPLSVHLTSYNTESQFAGMARPALDIPMVVLLSRIRSTRFVMVCILTMAMVFAHWQGLSHRISHASQHPNAGSSMAAITPAGAHQKALPHSCLAYDAATVAPALHTPTCVAGILPGGQVLALWAAFDSWDAPFHPYFSSRAPPFA